MNNSENNLKLWTPCEDILHNFDSRNYGIIVLNCKININIDHRKVLDLWSHAKIRVSVDGGTKRWLTWLEAHQIEVSDIFHPDLITGDLDSLSADILNYFEKRGSKIVKTPDQNETDFTKALRQVQQEENEVDTFYVLADTSGRFDQIIGNINTLFKAATFMKDKKIYQIASNSITWLLTPGSHKISIPQELRDMQEWCALIPMGAPCIASSTGLKWNLDKTKLMFGDMVSTSNTYSGEPMVNITTDGSLIWSMGIEAIL